MRISSVLLSLAAVLMLFSAADAQEFTADNVINRTVVLSTAVHFNDPEGEVVVVPPGAYWVIPASDALELLNLENGDTTVIRATAEEHTEGLTEVMAVSTPGTEVQPDVHSITFMFIDGTGLIAEGSYSGIQPRGLLGDAKKKADAARQAARQRAQAAKRRAQMVAAEARRRAELAAAEARRRTMEAAARIRNEAEKFLNISCEDKVHALQNASQAASATLQNLASSFPGRERPAQQALKDLIKLTIDRNPAFFREALLLRDAARQQLDPDEIEKLVVNGACGVNPAQTQAELQRIFRTLQQSVSSQAAVQSRAAPPPAAPPPDDPFTAGLKSWRDGGFGTSVSLEVLGGAGAVVGGGLALGIAGGYAGSESCPMPNVTGFCARNYFYRQLGVVTDVEAGVGLAVGLWAANPRHLQGLYTVVGGSADTSVGPSAGIDLVFDGNLRRFIECALERGAAQCVPQTKLLGATVGVGVSASLSPAEVHVQMGGEWTWWWKDKWVYDFQGPTPLWQHAATALGLQ